MRTIPIVLGAVAVGLAIAAAFLFLTQPNTRSVERPIAFSMNEVLLFPEGGHLGPSFSFATWSLTVQNNSNETQRLVVSFFSNGLPGDFQSITLNSSQRVSRTGCEGLARNGSSYKVSVFVSSSTGSTNFTVPATTRTATRIPFSGQVVVVNNLLNTSASFSGTKVAAGEWNMTVQNNGTKPIIFFDAALFGSNASQSNHLVPSPIFSFSSCPYPEYYGGQSREVSPQSPLTPGQSFAVSSPSFTPGVTPGQAYSVDYMVGFSDGTEVVFTASVQAK